MSSQVQSPNWQWKQAQDFSEGDRGTMALGVKDISPFIPEVVVATEDFETDPISGSGTWTLTASSPHTGLRCLRSAVIGSNQTTDYTFNVPVGANFIRVWHRVSSEANFDFFRVLVDATIVFSLSGTLNTWQELLVPVSGAATVTFRYTKDGSSSVGLDAAFIDDIEWIDSLSVPAVQHYEPFHLNEDNCVKVVLCDNEVVVTGEVNTRPLTCETDSVTVCIDQVVPVSGTFEVVIPEPLEVDLTSDVDVFGAAISSVRFNQAEIDFSLGLPGADYVSVTTAGGGSVNVAGGQAQIATSAGVNGSARIESVPLVDYRPGFEVYCWGTASFTTPTSVNSIQYLGQFDANNGYAFGYQGLTFGILRRSGGVDTFTPQGSWNIDTLVGGVGSKFTRNGVPESFNPTLINVFRVRYGWFGSAVAIFELLSPDGEWVEVHIIRNPNSANVPHIQNPNLPVAIQATKTGADGTNLIIRSGCIAGGVTSDIEEVEKEINNTSLAKLVKAVISGRTPTGDYVNVRVNSQGRLFVTNDAVFPEDSPHVTADNGIFVLAVRNDAGGPLSGNGDYTPFTTDATGALRVTTPASVEVSNDVGNPLPVTFPTGTLSNGAETAVAAAAVQVAAANGNRKAILLQNVGLANVRVGVSGVTVTTGFRLVPGQIVILEMPFVPTQAIFAIREGAISSTVLAQEIT